MNCDDIREWALNSRPLTPSAEQHLLSCPACQATVQALTFNDVRPAGERIDGILNLVTTSLEPVQPLPSNRALASSLLTLFVAFSLVATILFGYHGFQVLNTFQRIVYYSVIMLYAIWFSVATVEQMIPGSKRRTNPQWLPVAALLSLALLAAALFPNFELERFAGLGVPCLRLGSVCALLSGAFFWLIFRKGFFTSPLAAGITAGFLAGLAGVAVLALHCPILNALHVVVWHLGAMIAGGMAGAIASALPWRH
jgi:hypothetical protein